MAITWGPEVSNSYAGAVRLGREKVSQTYNNGSTLTAASTELRYTYRVYMQSRGVLSSPSNTLYGDGEAISNYSKPFAFDTSGESLTAWHSSHIRLIDTHTDRFPLQYGQSIKETGYWWATGIAGSSSNPRTDFFNISVPARPYSAPAAPSGVGITRSSDTKHVINWTRNSPGSASAPYQNVIVQRWDDVSNVYKTIATVGNVSSYTDAGTAPGRRYRWRVASKNSGGQSAWAYSEYQYTTPAAPTNVKATRSGADVVISWTPSVSPHTRSVLAYRPGTGAWEYPEWTSTGTSYVVKSPDPSVEYTYAVLARAENTGSVLKSAWAWSNTVQLLAPPARPSGLSPSVADAAEAITVSWRHNSRDTSEQTAYALRWRLNGETAWTGTGKTASATSSRVLPAGTLTAGLWEVQAQTWGAHADPSGWSSSLLLQVTERPSVTITEPAGGPFPGSEVILRWDFYDPEGGAQAQAVVSLYAEDGQLLWSRDRVSSYTAAAVGVTLQDGLTYVLGVTARDSAGLWSTEERVTISVAYAPPSAAELSAQWQPDTGAVVLGYSTPDPGEGEVPAVSVSLERSTGGGDWETLFKDLPASGAVVDPAPALNVTSFYRAVSVSSLPSTRTSPALQVLPDGQGWTYLNGGPGLSRMVRVRGGTTLDYTFDRALELIPTAGGSGKPLAVVQDETEQEIRVSARLAPAVGGSSTYAELRAFIREVDPPILFRDPTGERLWVAVHGLKHSARNNIRTASFSVTEVADDLNGE